MPRKPLITDWERTIIAMVYNQNREDKAEAIRQIASKRCGRKLGLSTVQRELAKLRKDQSRGSTDPLDDQWSLASLRDYPIAAPAIQLLLYIQSTFDSNTPEVAKKFAEKKGYRAPFLTNRLAVWFARLLILAELDPRIIEEAKSSTGDETPNKWPEWIDDLVSIAIFYSNYEIGCELAHIKPVNTVMFDAPTLDQIKLNILMYLKDFSISGFSNLSEEEQIEIGEAFDIRSIVRKGGKFNARSHNKKR